MEQQHTSKVSYLLEMDQDSMLLRTVYLLVIDLLISFTYFPDDLTGFDEFPPSLTYSQHEDHKHRSRRYGDTLLLPLFGISHRKARHTGGMCP